MRLKATAYHGVINLWKPDLLKVIYTVKLFRGNVVDCWKIQLSRVVKFLVIKF